MGIQKIEGFRISSQQKRLYQLDSEGYLNYKNNGLVRIEGILNTDLLEKTINHVISKYEILRSRFRRIPGKYELVQIIEDSPKFLLTKGDLLEMSLNLETQDEWVLLQNHKQESSGFKDDSTLRVSFKKAREDLHYLWIILPAMCSDSVTLKNLVLEIAHCYDASEQDKKVIDEVMQYADIAEWQYRLLEDESAEEGRRYWKEQITADCSKRFPFENREHTSSDRYVSKIIVIKVPEELSSSIVDLTGRIKLNEEVFFLTCWQLLISRLTGESIVTVGCLRNGRSYDDLSDALGPLSRYLPVKFELLPIDLERVFFRVDRILNEIGDYEEYYEWDDCNSGSGESYFCYGFDYEESAPAHISNDGVSFQLVRWSNEIDRFMLRLSCMRKENSFELTLHYDANVLRSDGMNCLGEQYLQLLRSAVQSPELEVRSLSLQSQLERQRIEQEFNATFRRYENHKSIHAWIDSVSMTRPDQVALDFEGKEMTYYELNTRANHLAQYLRSKLVQSGSLVALCMDRSLEMMVAVLGILKTGAAYVPIEPSFPTKRITGILEDCGVRLAVVHCRWLELFSMLGVEVVSLDNDWEQIEHCDCDDFHVEVDCNDLAYVIFTSGSTGQPKGVCVEHGQLINYVNGVLDELDDAFAARFGTFSSLATDLGNTAIYSALCFAGTLQLVSSDLASDPDRLSAFLKERPLDCLKIAPSHLEGLLEANEAKYLLPRSCLILGGEVLSWRLLDRIRSLDVSCSILNHYGPTETTVGVSVYRTDNYTEQRSSNVPIGKPLANSRLQIMEEMGTFAPIGVCGELYIAGLGVSRGYLNRPELTHEKFIEDLSKEKSRMYCTGDLVRWLPDGNVEFLGRIDHQVKIRGHRVELGEIESLLRDLDEVKEAVVTAVDQNVSQEESHFLCAYVVGESSLSAHKLRESLKADLPAYMVPLHFIRLSRLPLLSSGKVDLKALPEPDKSFSSENEYVAPRNEREEKLVSIWQEILGVKHVGINDDFFELGGHSLKMITLLAKVNKVFEVGLQLPQVFHVSTIAGLSDLIESSDHLTYVKLKPVEKRDCYPASSQQKRLYALQQFDLLNTAYNMPRVYLLNEKIDLERFQTAMDSVVARHESLRTSFEVLDGELVQRIHDSVSYIVEQEEVAVEDVEGSVRGFVHSFDLSKAPLLRAKVLQKIDGELILLTDMHHIISDGVSNAILMKDFARAFEGYQLEPLPLQYKDYAVWQQEGSGREMLESQEKYWLRQYEDEVPLLNLPTDFSRSQMHDFSGASIRFDLSEKTTVVLREFCRQKGVTLYMFLLSCYTVLLLRYSGQEDVVVGTPVAGRDHFDLNEIIGMFVNTLALRSRPEGSKKFEKYLEEVKTQFLQSLTNQQYPFEELIDRIDLERDTSRNPLFDTMLMVQNVDRSEVIADLGSIRPYQLRNTVAKFDLTVTAWESEETIALSFEYATSLFKEETIVRLFSHLERIVEEVVFDSNEELLLLEINILSDSERDQLLKKFNATGGEYPCEKCIQELFEQQVEKTPNAVAIAFGDETLTYAELNERSNRLAWRLSEQYGIGVDVLVGLCLERSLEMIIGILGILKAGGAYLPIDLQCPVDRIEFMLKDSEVKVLLVKGENPAGVVFTGTVLDLDSEESYGERVDSLVRVNRVSDMVYVIYTSGSTGKPKGVIGLHQGAVNRFRWMWNTFPFEDDEVCCQKTTINFVDSVWEIFGPLLQGVPVVVIPNESVRDARLLTKVLKQKKVTRLVLVPSLLRALLSLEDVGQLDGVKLWVASGESLPEDLIESFRLALPNSRLLNLYGSSEVSADIAYWDCMEYVYTKKVLIGCPIYNIRIQIVDQRGSLVPIGVMGELCVSGEGLARGYLNRVELTAEKFICNPFEPGILMYRTGDLARWLPDGTIEFLGRLDDQVKMRGFRIELGEIEAALAGMEEIKEAVVFAKEINGEMSLVAYYVVTKSVEIVDLRDSLQKSLPSYMIPSYFVEQKEIPLTSNGKVDRKALPEPDSNMSSVVEYVAPRNEIEQRLVDIWQGVLKIDQVGIHDNFFELGGNSIMLIILLAKVNKEFAVELELSQVLDTFTVAGLFPLIECRDHAILG